MAGGWIDGVSDPYADLRREYADGGLAEADLAGRPVRDVPDAGTTTRSPPTVYEPNAMVVASVSGDGRPSARMVLLKGFSEEGWVFFTNLGSRKGTELLANPRCRAAVPVAPAGAAGAGRRHAAAVLRATRSRRTSTRGRAAPGSAPTPPTSRARSARARSWTTPGRPPTRRTPDEVPVPDEWGGFRVAPEAVEFWQGRPGRMHDRLVYRRDGDSWSVHRLAP